jgi:LysM repeat protein
MSARRLLAFIMLNVVISATVVLAILYLWDSRQPEAETTSEQAVIVPTAPTISSASQAALDPTVETEIEEEGESGPPMYTVQAGDTLGKISREFDVSIDDIMVANNMDNPNFLQVGQQLLIPVGGIPTATPVPTNTPSPILSPTPISAELPVEGEANVEISDVVGVGDVEEEAVSIVNSGSRPIALLGWRLSDADGRTYTFGQVTLFGEGAAIVVHSGDGQEGPADLYWGFDEAIWEPGETITLVDAEGTVRATYVVGET